MCYANTLGIYSTKNLLNKFVMRVDKYDLYMHLFVLHIHMCIHIFILYTRCNGTNAH